MTVTPSLFPQFMKAQSGGAGFGTIIGEAVVTLEDELSASVELEIDSDAEGAPIIAGGVNLNTAVEGAIAVSVEASPLVVVIEVGVCDGP